MLAAPDASTFSTGWPREEARFPRNQAKTTSDTLSSTSRRIGTTRRAGRRSESAPRSNYGADTVRRVSPRGVPPPFGIHERGIDATGHGTDLSKREGGGRRGDATHSKGGYMKILTRLTVVTAVVLAIAAQGSAAGTTTSSVYIVDGTTTLSGLNTGLFLKNGRPVTVTATGVVCVTLDLSVCVTPDGDPSVVTTQSSFALPGARAYGLFGRVGSGPWKLLGSGPTPLSGKGELVLAMNDDRYDDNSGSFTVTVSYANSGVSRECWPGWGHGDDNHVHCGPPGLANKPDQSSQPQGSSNEHGKSEEKGNPKK
jgi:hypothetical protein